MDILIKDFQRFRKSQELVNKEITLHSTEEDKVQARILTTLRWHSVIGGGIVVSMGTLWAKVLGV
jgi:hypothetical protein